LTFIRELLSNETPVSFRATDRPRSALGGTKPSALSLENLFAKIFQTGIDVDRHVHIRPAVIAIDAPDHIRPDAAAARWPKR
jgi:hypothetical protein